MILQITHLTNEMKSQFPRAQGDIFKNDIQFIIEKPANLYFFEDETSECLVFLFEIRLQGLIIYQIVAG